MDIEKKTEYYWKKRCELLEAAVGYLPETLRKEILHRASGYAGGKSRSQKDEVILKDTPDAIDVHVDAIMEEISKPEITEGFVRIPVNDCKITATIDIDRAKGIKALYCGDDKEIGTYLFPEDKFTMSEARAWIDEHKTEKSVYIERYNWLSQGDVTKEQLMGIYDKAKGLCNYCHKKVETPRFSPADPRGFDHINSMAKGGKHTAGNMVVCCLPCNSIKGGQEHGTEKSVYDTTIEICKVDEEKRLVYGIVLEPDTVDSQDDTISAAEIERSAHKFMKDSQAIFSNHTHKESDVFVVESYIAQVDMENIKKGSWVMVTFCGDNVVWEGVKKGEFTGFSIRGTANRT